jgi:hypothetical protein
MADQPDFLDIVLQTRVDAATNAKLDAWRRQQERIPGTAEALRQLLRKALASEAA